MAQNGGVPLAGAHSDEVITVVLTADNHLGYGGLNGYGRDVRRREERLRRLRGAFQRATDFAVGQGVDLFVQAGDLFDTPNPTEEDRSFVAARLAELRQAGVRVFAVSGMHDTPGDGGTFGGDEDAMAGSGRSEGDMLPGLAPQVSYARLGALHYFPPLPISEDSDSRELEAVVVDVHGVLVSVCGLCSPPMFRGGCAGQEGDPLARVRVPGEVERAAVSLLVLHAPIEGLALQEDGLDGGGLAEVAQSTIAGQSSFGVILAGYHHGYRRLRVGGTDVIVAGATQHVDFGDADEGQEPGFVFLGLAADGVRWCQHIGGETLHVRRVVVDVAELWGDGAGEAGGMASAATDVILERLGAVCGADAIVQLRLVGVMSRDQYHQLDVGRIRRYGEERCFDLGIDESGLSLLPVDSSKAAGAPHSNGQGAVAIRSLRPPRVRVNLTPTIQASAGRGLHASPQDTPVGGAGRVQEMQNHAPGVSEEMEERLSPREELVNLADEWIAEASDEQERKALIATKEELLTALERAGPVGAQFIVARNPRFIVGNRGDENQKDGGTGVGS